MGALTCGAKPLFANIENQRILCCNLISVMIVRLKTTKCIDKWTISMWGWKKRRARGFFEGILAAGAIRHVQCASVPVVNINCQDKSSLRYGVRGTPMVWSQYPGLGFCTTWRTGGGKSEYRWDLYRNIFLYMGIYAFCLWIWKSEIMMSQLTNWHG